MVYRGVLHVYVIKKSIVGGGKGITQAVVKNRDMSLIRYNSS